MAQVLINWLAYSLNWADLVPVKNFIKPWLLRHHMCSMLVYNKVN